SSTLCHVPPVPTLFPYTTLFRTWVRHYNMGRPHMSLGPGIPQPSGSLPVPLQECRHRLPKHLQVVACRILGGLHHDYRLEGKARSEEHTSELQSRFDLVCRLLLE